MKHELSIRTPDMSLVRDSFLFPLEQQFDRFFRDFFDQSSNLDTIRATGGYPKLDIYEDDEHWFVKAAVPGVKVEDLSIDVSNGNTLTISGQMHEEYRKDSSKAYYRELNKTKFSRQVIVPNYVEGEPEAELSDGILTLKWKHTHKRPPPVKKVEIKTVQQNK